MLEFATSSFGDCYNGMGLPLTTCLNVALHAFNDCFYGFPDP
jgi:hypothetical protein